MIYEAELLRFGRLSKNFNLGSIARFGVGGATKFLIQPTSEENLCAIMRYYSKDIEIIGNCSNLLIRDGGIDSPVIKLGEEFAQISVEKNMIHAGAGALLGTVAYSALEAFVGGLEFFVGIPGSVGGAIAMNAGGYGQDMASVLEYVTAIDEYGNTHQLTPSDMKYVYRGHNLKDKWVFTKVVFRGIQSEYACIRTKMKDIMDKKMKTQPFKSMTCGSTFKNPPGMSAWQLIDSCGCRGLKIGGATVSDLHCNFLINTGKASAQDIETLGEIVRAKVYEKYGIMLEWEIKIVGNTI